MRENPHTQKMNHPQIVSHNILMIFIGYHVRLPEVTCVCWQDWWWFIILAILCMKVCCGASSTCFFLGEPVATPWSELKWMGLRHPDVLAS